MPYQSSCPPFFLPSFLTKNGYYLIHRKATANMSGISIGKVAGLSAWTALVALSVPYLSETFAPQILSLTSLVSDLPIPDHPLAKPLKLFRNTTISTQEHQKIFFCDESHSYRTELVSLDPLIIYIHNLITPSEITSLLDTAEPMFKHQWSLSMAVNNKRKTARQARPDSHATTLPSSAC